MKEIKTNKGELIKVDEKHFDVLNEHTWHVDANGYAVTTKYIRSRKESKETGLPRKKFIKMHRLVYELEHDVTLTTKEHIDHINRDRIDNRIENIRVDLQGNGDGINQINQGLRSDNTSGYKGVFLRKRTGRWESSVSYKGKKKWLGSFDSKEEAAVAYNEKVIELHGEDVYLNDV